MLNTVLVPLDGSGLAECVLPHAVAIAKAFDAQVTLLNILEQPSESLRMPKADPLDWYLKKTEADIYLSGAKTRLEKCDLSVKKVLLEGRVREKVFLERISFCPLLSFLPFHLLSWKTCFIRKI